MNEYNNSIEELLKDFEEPQIKEIIKQVTTNTAAPIGCVRSNFFNPENYERGETSNPFRNYKASWRTTTKKAYPPRRRNSTINEQFQPKNPIIPEPIPVWRYFLNIDCATDIQKALILGKQQQL